jgi:hypothetical protein
MEVVAHPVPAADLEEYYTALFTRREIAYVTMPNGEPSQEGLAFQAEAIQHVFELQPVREAAGLVVSSRVREVTDVSDDLRLKQSVEKRREILSGKSKYVFNVSKKLLRPEGPVYAHYYIITQDYDGSYSATHFSNLLKRGKLEDIDMGTKQKPLTWFDLAAMSADISYVEDRVRSVSRSFNLDG